MGMTVQAEQSEARNGPPLPPPSYGDPKKCDAAALRKYQDSRLPYTNEYRMRQHRTWRKADLFDESVQWLTDSFNNDPTRTVHWASIEFRDKDNAIPLPTFNEFSGPIENETARLGRPEYEPYIRARGEKPDIKVRTAAKLAEKVLKHCLEENRWNEQADMGELHMPLYGGWFLYSYWDLTWEETTRIPVLTAQKCPECDFKLTDKADLGEGAAEMALQKPEAIQRTPVDDPDRSLLEPPRMKYGTDVCLTCEEHTEDQEQDVPVMDPMGQPAMAEDGITPLMETQTVQAKVPGPPMLEPFTPIKDELHAKDHFGRDLGQDVQLGKWKVKTLSPYDVFLDNLGIDYNSIQDVPEFTYVHVETLDWLCNRYDNGHLVKPEDARTLLEWHPVGGERSLYHSSTTPDKALFQNRSRVKETHRKPWRVPVTDDQGKPVREADGKLKYKMNRGRTLVMSGDVVLFDGDSLMESKTNPGVMMPRTHLDYAAWKLRSGGRELQGTSMSVGLFDPQENINEINSQVQDARQHEGSLRWLIDDQMDMDYDSGAGSGARWIYKAPLDGSNRTPIRLESKLFNADVYKELEGNIDFMNRHANLNEVEGGNVPDNVAAALALQFLAEQSGERRRPRIRRIREMLMRVFKHGLDLMHELVREPRTYWDRDDNNEWAQKSWDGMKLLGQTDVRIDAEPESDTDVQEQQRIQDAINLRVINPENPRGARLIAKKMKVPSDLYEEENLQDESAEREFCQFMDEGIEPVVDVDLDSPQLHVERHGIDLHNERWRDLATQAGYAKASVFLNGWEAMFDQQQQPAMGPPDPMTGQPTTVMQVVPGLDQQMGDQWPPLPELRIMLAWQMILEQKGYKSATPQEGEALNKYLRARAHLSAHKRAVAAQAQATQQGAQVVAAPEAPKTPDGTIPEGQGMIQ